MCVSVSLYTCVSLCTCVSVSVCVCVCVFVFVCVLDFQMHVNKINLKSFPKTRKGSKY